MFHVEAWCNDSWVMLGLGSWQPAVPRIAYHLASRAHRYWFREVQTRSDQIAREKKGKFSGLVTQFFTDLLTRFDDFCYFCSIIEGRQRSHHITPYHTMAFCVLGHHGMNKGNGIVPSPSVGICGMLGIPWPQQHQQHAAPEEPYGLGSQRTLADYEGPHGSHGMPIFCQMKKQHVATFENPLPIIGPLVWRIVLHVSTCFKFFTMKYPKTHVCSRLRRRQLRQLQPSATRQAGWAARARLRAALGGRTTRRLGHGYGQGPSRAIGWGKWDRNGQKHGKIRVSQMKSCRFSLQHIVFFRRVWIFVERFI